MNTHYSKILGTGSYVPEKVLSNADLEKMVETSNEWILERTGIETRRISKGEGELPADMGAEAAKKAIEAAGLEPNDIDLILFATVTGEYQFPSCSALLQQKIGITTECPCMDLAAACSGFIYGLVTADAMIKSGLYKNVLVVGAEMLSPFVDWEDRGTCILFGDGAGAAILGPTNNPDEGAILASSLGCDGTGAPLLEIPSSGSANPISKDNIEKKNHLIKMEGRSIFKYATRTMIRESKKVLEKTGLNAETLDWFIPHQANLRIIEYIAKKLELDMEKAIVTVTKYGNNSSATIPIAFDEAIREGKIKRGHTVAFGAFGAGVTSGAILLRY